MIGAKRWDGLCRMQVDLPTEKVMQDLIDEWLAQGPWKDKEPAIQLLPGRRISSLQLCGAAAAENAAYAVGVDTVIRLPGGGELLGADVVSDVMNARGALDELRRILPWWDPDSAPNSRQPGLIPWALREVWGLHARVLWKFEPSVVMDHLERGRVLMVVKTPPGHWVTIDAYDEAAGEYVGDDSVVGKNVRYKQLTALREYAVVVCPPGDKGD